MADEFGFSMPNMPFAATALRRTPEEQAEALRRMQAQAMTQQVPQQASPQASALRMPNAREDMQFRPIQGAELEARNAGDQIAIQDSVAQRVQDDKWRGGGLAMPVAMIRNAIGKDERRAKFTDQETQRLTQARAQEDGAAERKFNQDVDAEQFSFDAANYGNSITQAGLNNRAANTIASQENMAANTLEGQNTRAANTINAANARQDDQQDFTAATANATAYHDGNGGIINVMRDPETFANFTVGPGGLRTPVDTSRLTPYTASTQSGSRELAAQVRASEQRLTEGGKQIVDDMQSSTLGRILNFGDLEAATGRFDVRRIAANLLPVGDRQENIQSMGRQLNNARTLAMGPVLSMMGVNPTDADMAITLEGTPTANEGPRVWIDYVRDEFAPAARSTALLRLQEGLINDGRTAEDIELAYTELVGMADAAEKRIFGSASAPELGGFDPSAPYTGALGDLNDAQQDALLEFLLSKDAAK